MLIFGLTPRIFAGFVAAVLALSTHTALAQTLDSTATEKARALVDEASRLMDDGKFVDACPKLEIATLIVPDGIGAKMALGECYVGAGRLASAWEQYRRAEVVALGKGDDRAEEARNEWNLLEPRIARLTIVVPENVRAIAGFAITLDNIEQPPPSWGGAIRIDEGIHTLVATAPRRKPWRDELKVKPNTRSIARMIPVLDTLPLRVANIRNKLPSETPDDRGSAKSTATFQNAATFLLLTTGVTELGAGSILIGYAQIEPEMIETNRESYTRTGIALISVGTLSLTGAVLLMAIRPKVNAAPNPHNARIQWHFGLNPNGIGLHGTW